MQAFFKFKKGREVDRQQKGKKLGHSHSLSSFSLSLSPFSLPISLPPPRFHLRLSSSPQIFGSQLLNQYDCVTTPAEFAAAFKANTPRCVSEDLVGRLSSGNSVAQAANRSVSFSL